MQQWNLAVEQKLPGNLDLQVAYVGTKGTRFAIQQYAINRANNIASTVLASALSTYESTGVNPLTTYVTNP